MKWKFWEKSYEWEYIKGVIHGRIPNRVKVSKSINRQFKLHIVYRYCPKYERVEYKRYTSNTWNSNPNSKFLKIIPIEVQESIDEIKKEYYKKNLPNFREKFIDDILKN